MSNGTPGVINVNFLMMFIRNIYQVILQCYVYVYYDKTKSRFSNNDFQIIEFFFENPPEI